MDIFDRLIYFKRTEHWGDPARMNGALLILLDAVRGIVGFPFVIHSAYRAGAGQGEHGYGNAVDFHIEGLEPYMAYLKLIEALAELQALEFVGLGVYPQWNNPGFHLDGRGRKARWGQLAGKYCGIDEALAVMKA